MTNHGGSGWKTVTAGDDPGIGVTVRATGLVTLPVWITGPFDPVHLADLIEALTAVRAIGLGHQECGECGEQILWSTGGVDGEDRWYHTSSGRAFCYQNPEHNETAYPHPNRQPERTD